MNKSRLILVGAGPGAADLITLRGVKAIAQADVILYDALIDNSLLAYASTSAIKIFVGKRVGAHYASQSDINALIVEYALQNKVIVRLKGGDPGIFGRMAEEITTAYMHNIDVEVVPGVSSVTGIPALQQIPLTQRGSSESIWITTGTTSKCELSSDIEFAAQTSATVIIVMGMSRLLEIVNIFRKYRGDNHPIALIHKGSTMEEKSIFGTLGNIMTLMAMNPLQSPTLILIGTTKLSE